MDAVQGCMERDVDYLVATGMIDHVLLWSYIERIDGVAMKRISFVCRCLVEKSLKGSWVC